MEELKLITPYSMFAPSEQFPSSDELPEGASVVKWTDRPVGAQFDLKANVVYQELSGEQQHLQIITPLDMLAPPDAPSKTYPLIVYIPGSAWHRQNVWIALTRMIEASQRGYVVAIVE
ncbi:MAG: alpha/beta hydrolase, partial [Oscillospiraceae bacterium]|nr:alpha/beta hydrolase [Oscillospiraceae bacterium]